MPGNSTHNLGDQSSQLSLVAMHHATLLTIVAAAALGAIAQDASSLGDLYESIHISSSDGSEQLYVSPMYIVTTDNTKSRNPAKFSITEWETLWNGEARCQFNMRKSNTLHTRAHIIKPSIRT